MVAISDQCLQMRKVVYQHQPILDILSGILTLNVLELFLIVMIILIMSNKTIIKKSSLIIKFIKNVLEKYVPSSKKNMLKFKN